MSGKTKMQYVRLGNSGLKVSRIILGTMSYGDPSWDKWLIGEEEAIKHIKFAYDWGVTTFDTSDTYSNGLSEIILGNAVKKLNLPREELVIMTKIYFPVASDYGTHTYFHNPHDLGIINQLGLSRKHIFDGVKASLKRLQMDYIDVLQCHRFDTETPISETMRALDDLVKAGLVRYIGMSSCWAYQFHQMQNYAITHNLTPFISMQNNYSLLYREEEREMMPTLELFGVGCIPWSPLARGILCRPAEASTTRGSSDPAVAMYQVPSAIEIVNRVEEISRKKGVSMAQVAIAWVLSKPGVVAPVIGATKIPNLEDTLDGIDVTLTEEEITYLEEPYKPMPTKYISHD
ncbi:Aldo/keto reductase [Dichomitus squalens LYAD-421 SS1]|uniref:Aldo/keto reductase n=1 Tax=Dichomitus squalens (strain LYAD-421) TaxID=732165 RepID=R7SYI7_DICSQ|nr:Aldo/keto reductase [Dichomitus squalens LYAD-421 SS1]EJF61028.1 Aldo/keto reductase [Dichomitus squalens LYAD-421 SS1]